MARTSADITIHRIDGTTLPVPITPEARRTWRLMREDNIRLRWGDASEYRAKVGDWVDDELFGKFYVTEEQEPTFDTSTGAYMHDVRFDRDYIGWRNVLHMLTYDNGTSRKETEWSLTDSLANHLAEVVKGLVALGYTCGTPVVESTVENPEVAVSISFSGTSVYDALNALAEAYSCEWWVTYNSDYTVSTIHFGKYETGNSTTDIALGVNAEDVTPTKSGGVGANRIFAYGSTRNIPETYRKTLTFEVTDTDTRTYDGQSATVFRDANRVVTKDMLKADDTLKGDVSLSLGSLIYSDAESEIPYREAATSESSFTIIEAARYAISGRLSCLARFKRNDETIIDGEWSWSLTIDNTVIASDSGVLDGFEQGTDTIVVEIDETLSDDIMLAIGEHTAVFDVRTLDSHFKLDFVKVSTAKVSLQLSGYKVECPLVYGGDTYTVVFNPLSEPYSQQSFNWFSFKDSIPSGFTQGSSYTLAMSDGETEGLLPLKVPVSFYSDDMGNLSSLKMVGERRLMLPSPGYVQDGTPSGRELVERVVIFENIYPKLYLQITDITEGTYTDNTEWSDGSRSYGSLPKFTVKARMITSGGLQDFNFKRAYLTSDPLKAVFVTYDEKHGPDSVRGRFLLSGMTFGLNFNEAAQTYTIAFNEDYGAKLPNSILKPQIGDVFILTGWDVNAIESLGIVRTAEDDLYDAADAYLDAVSKPTFTWRCRMMSDSMMSGGLLNPGQKVRIGRKGFDGNVTWLDSTRVIGFEYKLDIPEDTPEYDCGETEAYSRLRELEKALNATTRNTSSASGGALSSSSLSSRATSDGAILSAVLSWQTGAIDPASGDTFDGTEDKLLVIPSEIGHLSDGNIVPRIDEVLETLDDGSKVVRLVDGDGIPVLPSGSMDWFIVESYTEEEGSETVTKQRLKLNPKYQGMYAEGYVSAGGLSDGGGGVVGDYLPLTGGTMSGPISMAVSSSTANGATLKFMDGDTLKARVGSNTGGLLQLYATGNIVLRPGDDISKGIVITTNDVTFNNLSVAYRGLYSPTADTSGYGYLVKTTIASSTEAMLTFHVTGMAYHSTADTPLSINTTISFWNRSGTGTAAMGSVSGVSNGYDLGTIYAFVHNPNDASAPFGTDGRLYLWFARPSRYSSVYVHILNAYNSVSPGHIESITYAAMPGDSSISRKTAITPQQAGGSISEATTGALGGFKLSVAKRSTNVPSSSFNTGGTTTGRYYGVEMNNAGQLYVNVPWQSGSGGSNVAWGTTSNHKATLTVDGNTKTVLLDGWSQDLSSYAPLASPAFTGNPTAPTQSTGNNSTRIATTAFVQTAVGDYLPLAAGSGKPLTGSLYSQSIIPTGTSKTYNLGSTSKFFKYAYVDRIYIGGTGVYIYMENGCLRTNAPIVSDSYISAGGVSTT